MPGVHYGMQVSEIMTSPVISVGPESDLREVVEAMLAHHVGSVLVIDAGLIGIVTRSDVLRAVYHLNGSIRGLTVTDAMSEEVITATRTDSITTVLSMMEEHNIKKLPVVEDLNVVGIVTMTDIAQHQPTRVREVRESIERKDDWTD